MYPRWYADSRLLLARGPGFEHWLVVDEDGADETIPPRLAVQIITRAAADEVVAGSLRALLRGLGEPSVDMWSHAPGERLEPWLETGRLRVIERQRTLPDVRPQEYDDPIEPHRPSDPPPAPEPVYDDDRALVITRCDPALGAEGPLNFSYLIRDLAGRPVKLRILGSNYPDEVLHEVLLPPVATSDGVHDDTWDAVMTVGGHAGKRVSPAFGPCTLEIIHDDTYRDAAGFTLLDREVVIVEIGGFSFHTNREILLPDVMALAPEEPGPARVSGIVAAASVLRFAAEHPNKQLFIAGHTDTVGKQKDNLTLSADRAHNVQLYLAGDADGWAKHCQVHYEVEDVQRVLAWVTATFPEFDCDPGPIDNEIGPKTRQARTTFRNQYAQLTGGAAPSSTKQTVDDWKAYLELYDRAVQELLDGEGLDLETIRVELAFTDPPNGGFGESFPNDRPDVDALDSERNRRVEAVFLDPSEVPLVADLSGESLYGPEAGVRRKYIPLGFRTAHDEIAFRLVDEYSNPLRDILLELWTPDGTTQTARTGADGSFLFSAVLRGTCRLRLPEIDVTAWSASEVADRELPPPPSEELDPSVVDPEPVEQPFDAATKASVLDDDPWED